MDPGAAAQLTYPMNSTFCVLLILLTTLVGIGCGGRADESEASADTERGIPFRHDGTLTFVSDGEDLMSIDIEIADTDSARERGLMQRLALPDRSGMLFIFDREQPQSFWMGNTPLGLDLLFVGADSQIVDIDKYNKPYDPSSIVSDEPAKYVVEVPAGFTDTWGIRETDRVRWERKDGLRSQAE